MTRASTSIADATRLPVLVSACLLGESVRYDGGERRCDHAILRRWLAEGRVVPACPELAGGLPVPRPAAEITGGGGLEVLAGLARVVDSAGNDYSVAFVDGARRVLELAQAKGIRVAVLKEGSPSCGSGRIYDGSFSARALTGSGVAAALLRQAGIAVFSEEQFEAADTLIRRLEQGQSKLSIEDGNTVACFTRVTRR